MHIGYLFEGHWCYSGQNRKGKFGLFPAAFVMDVMVEKLKGENDGKRPSIVSEDSGQSQERRKSRFSGVDGILRTPFGLQGKSGTKENAKGGKGSRK